MYWVKRGGTGDAGFALKSGKLGFVSHVFDMTQYNILFTFDKIEIFALSNRRFNKLSNDTKFLVRGRGLAGQ